MPRPSTPPLPYEEPLIQEGTEEASDDCKNNPYIAGLSCALMIAGFVWGVYAAVTEPVPP